MSKFKILLIILPILLLTIFAIYFYNTNSKSVSINPIDNSFKDAHTGNFVFRNSTWGMTPEQVFAAEKVPYDDAHLDFSKYISTQKFGTISIKEKENVMGVPASLVFQFQDNKFFTGFYLFEFSEEDGHNKMGTVINI